MAFIRLQNIVKGEDGRILSGSAQVVESYYDSKAGNRNRQRVVMRLGRPISLDGDGKSGVFASEEWGLFRFDVRTMERADVPDSDPARALLPEAPAPRASTVFGDAYLLSAFLEDSGLLGCLRGAFPSESEAKRAYAHLLHSVLADGSRVAFDDFWAKCFASAAVPLPSFVGSDSAFMKRLGSEEAKEAFFLAFLAAMRKRHPGFGKCCYVDSTPVPNEIADVLVNGFSSHGLSGCASGVRVAMVLDSPTGFPVWYDVIPGNSVDVSTLRALSSRAEEVLGIELAEYALDAGYVSRELVESMRGEGAKLVTARMPFRRGFPYKEIYRSVKGRLLKGSETFVREGHKMFGKRLPIELFGGKCDAYAYVDFDNADASYKKRYSEDPEGYDALSSAQKDWELVRGGFFVLLSNKGLDAKGTLADYFGRTGIESYFKASKGPGSLLPLCKKTDEAARGKILSATIVTIATTMVRKRLAETGQAVSPSRVYGKCQSLMCRLSKDGRKALVEYPTAQAKAAFGAMGYEIPSEVRLADFAAMVLKGKREEEAEKPKRGRKKKAPRLS